MLGLSLVCDVGQSEVEGDSEGRTLGRFDNVGFIEGWMHGTNDGRCVGHTLTEGVSEGWVLGESLSDGDSDGFNVGCPDKLGPSLGNELGGLESDGYIEG